MIGMITSLEEYLREYTPLDREKRKRDMVPQTKLATNAKN